MKKTFLRYLIIGTTIVALVSSVSAAVASLFVILIAVFNLWAGRLIIGLAIEIVSCIIAALSWKALDWMAEKEAGRWLKKK